MNERKFESLSIPPQNLDGASAPDVGYEHTNPNTINVVAVSKLFPIDNLLVFNKVSGEVQGKEYKIQFAYKGNTYTLNLDLVQLLASTPNKSFAARGKAIDKSPVEQGVINHIDKMVKKIDSQRNVKVANR